MQLLNRLIEEGFWYSYDITVRASHSLFREYPFENKFQKYMDKVAMSYIIQFFSKKENLDFVPNDGEDHENE